MTFRTNMFLQMGRLDSYDVVFEYEVCCIRTCNLAANTGGGEGTKFTVPLFLCKRVTQMLLFCVP